MPIQAARFSTGSARSDERRAATARRRRPAAAPERPAALTPHHTPPAIFRDPWAAAPIVVAALLAARSWYPFIGEPVSDDFDYLHDARFAPGDWLDGGGSRLYWRPLARQVYFRMLGGALDIASRHLDRKGWTEALREIALADSLQHDPAARVSQSLAAGSRAVALLGLRRDAEALSEAERAYRLYRGNVEARYVIARLRILEGRLREAEAQLDTLVRVDPGNQHLRELLAETRRLIQAQDSQPPRQQ